MKLNNKFLSSIHIVIPPFNLKGQKAMRHDLPSLIDTETRHLLAYIQKKVRHYLPTHFMRKLAYMGMMAIIISSALVPVLGFILPSKVDAGWYNEDWHYRKSINFSHSSLENNVYVNLSGANAIDSSASGRFQADCGDIRFTDVSGNVLPYYLVSGCTTSTTVIHVLFSTLPAGDQTIFMYYGNPSVANGTASADFATAATGITFGTMGSEELAQSPVAQWKLDEGHGTTARDSSTNNLNGTMTSGPAWQDSTMCVVGKCQTFDGSDDYITVSNNSNLQITGNITIELWAYAQNNGNYNPMVSKGSPGEYEIAADFRSGITTLATRWEGAQKNFANFFSGYTNTWVHVAVVVDGGTIYAYRNGKLVGTTTSTARTATVNTVSIGRRTGDGYYWKGRFDEVAIYNYARSQSQIQRNYIDDSQQMKRQGGNLSNSLVGYWKMDESAANACIGGVNDSCDSSGVGRDLSWTGDTTIALGKFGNGTLLDGTGDYIGSGNVFTCTLDRTVSVWFKGTPASTRTIFEDDSCGSRFLIYYYTNNRLGFYPHNVTPMSSNGTYADNQWHHLVVTTEQINASEVEASIYVDGVFDKSQNFTFSSPDGSANDVVWASVIGGGNYFAGTLDEGRIYSRTLSLSEIQQLYNYAPPPFVQYEIEEASGSTYYNSAGNGLHNLGHVGNASTRKTGKYGQGVYIQSGGYLSAGGRIPPRNATLSAWVKPGSQVSGNIIGFGTDYQYVLNLTTDYRINLRISDDTTIYNLESAVVFSSADLGVWHHIAASYDGATIRYYVDGRYINSESLAVTPRQTSSSICMGYCGNGYFHTGIIDHALMYDYVRTQSQIIDDMLAGNKTAAGSGAYWKFDEGQGATISDSGPNSINGTITNCGWSNSGKFNQALDCGSGGGYVSVGNATLFQSSNLTLSMWLKTGTINSGGTFNNIIFGKETYQSNGFRYGLSDSGMPTFWTTQSGGNLSVTSTKSVSDGKWHHIVVTYDSTTSKAIMYIDGQPSANSTGTFIPNTTAGMVINGGVGGTTRSNSMFDEVRYLDFALSPQEIVADYNRLVSIIAGSVGSETTTTGSGGTGTKPSQSYNSQYCVPGDTSSCSAPIGEWKFEEGAGTTVANTTGSPNGSWIGNGSHWTTGRYGSGGIFNGTDDGVTLDSGFGAPTSITISTWFKTTSTSTPILGQANAVPSTVPTSYVPVFVIDSTGKLRAEIYTGSTGAITTTNSYNDGQWHHAVISASTGTQSLYVDGQLIGSRSGNTTQTWWTKTLLGAAYWNTGRGAPANGWYYFNGSLDQTRIYNYARSQKQVSWEFNQGAPVAWFKMDECQGSTINDSINKLTGAMTIGATGSQATFGTCTTSNTAWGNGNAGKYGSSFNTDGTDDYASIASTDILGVRMANFTLATWVKKNSNNTVDGLVWHGHDNQSHSYRILTIGTGQIQYGAGRYDTGYMVEGSFINDNEWHHLVVSFDGTTLRGYLDGKLDGTDSTGTYAAGNAVTWVGIGDQGTYNYFADAQMDDVQIYNYALSEIQIGSLFNGGSVRWGTGD